MIHHINKRKDKNYMIISIGTEKPFDKIQQPIMIRTLIKVGKEGTYLNIIKIIYNKNHSQHNTQQWQAESPPAKLRTRQYPLSSLLFNIVSIVLPP